jgi:hypothetical protein
MTVSTSTKRKVRESARHCCEYCRLAASSATSPFHVEHIIPQKHGGTDDMDNLCLACYKCNAHKGHDLTGFDPQTGEIARIYNPRKQAWHEHFVLQTTLEITGRTPEGRTTVSVLQMNAPNRLENRQILAAMGDYPCELPSV